MILVSLFAACAAIAGFRNAGISRKSADDLPVVRLRLRDTSNLYSRHFLFRIVSVNSER
ncbi:hypothetical protein BIFPSEUDO_04245 [Bifidobacterium pseudocatenulatum DSM 20438 = JCM 1200 = LMG 10505]|uniref:Uncharacterized protein n=1 Tax=Bifidobacterium pseudocatenulatum DSM 20438 = JCM 1200 = LMG 10505 TaxID=547043 RepID=C0BV04_BIFPS|nr:hypothetical protein BIFPSEUDO_04245 [Bifidobacterium pseudocatenulatum DSM 20438 = JCM 1200 = LMG 10505]